MDLGTFGKVQGTVLDAQSKPSGVHQPLIPPPNGRVASSFGSYPADIYASVRVLVLVHMYTKGSDMSDTTSDNGAALRKLIEDAGITQTEALAVVNRGQAFPISISTWKSYLAAPESARRRNCPDAVLTHATKTIGEVKKGT